MFKYFWVLNDLNALLDYVLRLLSAALAGFVIGYERKTRSKEAGVRTHTMVTVGAALMMIVSKYAFGDAVDAALGIKSVDGSRIAASIVSGMGFLGAGIIIYRKDTIYGLTTAAGIWTAAGIGMAFGGGMYLLGLCSTVLVLIIQIVLHLPIKLLHARTVHMVRVVIKMEDENSLDRLKELFRVEKFLEVRTYREQGDIKGDIKMNTVDAYEADTIYKIIEENEFILSIEKVDEI